MLIIAIIFIFFMIYVVHSTRVLLIEYLEKGDTRSALRILKTLDSDDKTD